MHTQPRHRYPGVNRGWTHRCGDAGVVTPYVYPLTPATPAPDHRQAAARNSPLARLASS